MQHVSHHPARGRGNRINWLIDEVASSVQLSHEVEYVLLTLSAKAENV